MAHLLGKAGLVRSGGARQGMAWPGMAGGAWQGEACVYAVKEIVDVLMD